MTGELRPYPEYKESGVPSLGLIPAHWDTRRAKYLYREVDERSTTGTEVLCSVSHKTGVTPRKANVTMFMAESTVGYKICQPDDLVINTLWAWMAALGIASQIGVVSPAYGVYRPRNGSPLLPEFANVLLRIPQYMREYMARSTGVNASRLRLYPDRFLCIPIILPPRPDQEAMVRFLRDIDKRVSRFIRNRRRLIEVLNEQKQAIIDRAVTRGPDPTVPLKPSELPKRWKVVALRYLATKFGSGVTPRGGATVYQQSGVPFLRSQNVHFDGLRLDGIACITHELHSSLAATHVRSNDVLLNITGASLGRVCAVPEDFAEGNVNQHVCIIRPHRDQVTARFLAAYLSTGFMQREIYIEQNGASREGLALDAIKAFKIILPPVEEQHAILDYIKTATANLMATCLKAEREIALIREYRTRLIADVVTGKLDVRNFIAKASSSRKAKPRKANVHFRRSVFAAEIVHRLHSEPTFGHVKFEKLIFLCEKHCGIDTGSNYRRQAAGPYDNRALRSIDSQLKKQNWYECYKGEKGYRYVPLQSAGGHERYFKPYFGDVEHEFDRIITRFRTAKTIQCEIVATLYSAWEDLLAKDGNTTDDQIIEQVLEHWHPAKKQIDETRWRIALAWMKRKDLVPAMERRRAND